MLLQHQSVNSWKRNMNKSTARRSLKKNTLPRSICMPEANDSISSEAKSQSSIISIKISNDRDANNVVIEWYRNYHNNKPFNDNYRTGLNMSKRQSAGGGCRNIEIKRSYPCLKCKELNKSCNCAKFRNLYRQVYGPTTDETILVGMETLHNLVSSRCSESDTSVKAVEGTVHHQQREYPVESGAPRMARSSDYNYRRDNDRNDRRHMPRDDDKPNNREKDNYKGYPRKDYCSDEGNIELLELDKKNQSQNRRRNGQEPRRDGWKSKGNSNNGNGRNGNKSGGTNEYNEKVRKQMLKDTYNKELFEDDDDDAGKETPSVYSDLSKFVSSEGITNDLHSDESSRLSLESRYTVENSVSSIGSKLTAQNPSPLVSDISNETLPDHNVEHAENHTSDTELKKICIAPPNSKYSFSNNPLFKQTDNGTNYSEAIAQNDLNEQLAQRQQQDNKFKRSVPNHIERNSINRCSNGLAKQVPCWTEKNMFEHDQSEESNSTSSEEKKCDTPEESDSAEYIKKSSTQLYTCLVNPINNVQTIPIMSKCVVPVWHREKPYPTVHFISSTRDLTNLRAGADVQEPVPRKFKKHTDLVDYLLNPMRYLNYVNNRETDSLRRSKSDSSLSVSSVHSAPRLFSEAATNTVHEENFGLADNKLNGQCHHDEWGNRVYIYDTGQTYLPTAEPEHKFAIHNNIGEILCYPVQFNNNEPTNESARNGPVSSVGKSFSVEMSEDENTDMSFSSESTNICTNSVHEENNVPPYDDHTKDLTEYDDENKTEVSLQNTIGDIWKSPSNKSMKLNNNNNDSIMTVTVSLSSLGSSSNIKSSTSISSSDISSSENNTALLREMNVIANDKREKQVLTPIQEETEISDSESSFTENETNLVQKNVQPKLSTEHEKVEKDDITQISIMQNKSTHAVIAMDNTSETTKEDIDEIQENTDMSESSPETAEIITIKQPSNSFTIESTVYSPVPTTCSCFTVSKDDDDDDDDDDTKNKNHKSRSGKRKDVSDKQINTSPVRIKRESKSIQTDPIKLRPIKSKVDRSSEFTATTASTTTAASADSVSVRRSSRRSTGTMNKSRKSSTKAKSVKFEQKSSKEDTKEVTNERLDSVTADESRENFTENQDMGDTIKSEPKLQKRDLQPRETRYAIARITKYDEFTTYEILKSTRAKPRIIPLTTEGVFTVRNRKKRKFKL